MHDRIPFFFNQLFHRLFDFCGKLSCNDCFHYSILFLGMQSNSMGGFSRDCGIAVEGVAFPRKRRPFRQNSAYAVENPVYNLPQMWNRKDNTARSDSAVKNAEVKIR